MSWVKGERLWIRRGRQGAGLTLAVRRKIGSAVVRNRLKRRLRSIYTSLEPRPDSLVVYPQVPAPAARFSELAAELQTLLDRL